MTPLRLELHAIYLMLNVKQGSCGYQSFNLLTIVYLILPRFVS